MNPTRRLLLGSLGTLAVIAASGMIWVTRKRSSAPVERLLIDPAGDNYVYRDGWIDWV